MASNRPIVLTVSADTTPLQRALQAGQSTLAAFGQSSAQAMTQINNAFAQLSTNPANAARAMEQSFASAVRNMQSAAQEAVRLGSNYNPLGGMTSKSSTAAADQLAQLAQAERNRAAAAATATSQDAAEAQVLRVLATASTSAALAFDEQAAALRTQANALKLVETEMAAAGTATNQATQNQNAMHTSGRQLNLGQMELAHVARATADAYAAGIPVSRIAAMEMGRLSEALMFYAQQSNNASGVMAKFAGIMSGPWGIALTIGIPLIIQLVSHFAEMGGEVEKATEKLRENAQQAGYDKIAHEQFSHTLEGLISTEDKLTESLKRQLQTRRDLNNEQVKQTQTRVGDAQKNYDSALTKRDNAQKEYNRAKNAMDHAGGDDAMVALGVAAAAEKDLNAAKKELADATRALAVEKGQERLAEANQSRTRAEELAQPHGKERIALEDERGRLDNRFVSGQIDRPHYDAENQRIANALAALGQQHTESAGTVNSLGGMEALVKQLFGANVSPHQAMGGVHTPGSEHYTGHAIDFVPAGGMNAFSYDEVKKMLEDAGVHISYGTHGKLQLFGPGHGPGGPNDHSHDNHYHVGFTGSPNPESAARVAEARQRKAEEAQRKADESKAAYTMEGDTLDSQLSQAKKKHLDTIDQQYHADLDALDDAKKEANDRIDKEAKLHGWTTAQTEALKLKEGEVDQAKREAVERDHQEKLEKQAAENAKFSADVQSQLLNLSLDLATTLQQRRDYSHQLLAIERKQALAAINADHSLDPKERDARLAQTNTLYDKKDKAIDASGDPMQDYTHRLHQNVDDLNGALQTVKADGLQSLEDGLLGLVSGTETVAGAFKKMASAIIADLARIAIEKMILKVLTFSDGGEVAGHAVGGYISGAGGSREDKIPARLSAGEFVINAAATARHRRLLQTINEGGSVPGYADGGYINASMVGYPTIPSARSLSVAQGSSQPIVFDLRGAVMTDDLLAQMNAIAARTAAATMVAAPQVAQGNMTASARRVIPT